jgi:hypothetical protein
MNRRRITIWITMLSVGAALLAAMASGAAAQYPEQIGGVIVASGDTTPGPNEDVPVTATVVDEDGNAVAGATCTFSVAEQPGADATVDAGPFTTDSNGEVSTTLQSGSSTGNIVVAASCCVDEDCGDELTAEVAVQVSTGDEAAPPASLPDTGSGAGTDGGMMLVWSLAIAGALLALAGLTTAGLAWRRSR